MVRTRFSNAAGSLRSSLPWFSLHQRHASRGARWLISLHLGAKSSRRPSPCLLNPNSRVSLRRKSHRIHHKCGHNDAANAALLQETAQSAYSGILTEQAFYKREKPSDPPLHIGPVRFRPLNRVSGRSVGLQIAFVTARSVASVHAAYAVFLDVGPLSARWPGL